jgi:hypothetical protein
MKAGIVRPNFTGKIQHFVKKYFRVIAFEHSRSRWQFSLGGHFRTGLEDGRILTVGQNGQKKRRFWQKPLNRIKFSGGLYLMAHNEWFFSKLLADFCKRRN